MLEPKYLQNVGDDLEKLYQELATEILVDIAERIKLNQDAMTSTTEYLNNKLKQLGLQQDWINKRLAEILHTSEEEVDRIMQQSAYKSIRDTFDRLEAGGYDTSGLEFSDQIKKGTSALWGDIQNLTRTTAQLASDTFMRYYDMAYLQVSSGAYSLDQATAAGTNQVQLYANGTAVPGAVAQVTTTAADNVITLPVSAVIQAAPAAPGNKVALTWVTSAAGTLINASETVSRIV